MNPLFVVILAASLPTFRDFSRIEIANGERPVSFRPRSHCKSCENLRGRSPLVCPKCQGAMRVISSIEDPSVIRDILNHRSIWLVRWWI